MGVTRFLMKAIGVWPLDDERALRTRCKFLLPGILLMFFIIIPQTRKAVQARNDLNLMLEVLTTADIIEGIALLKLLGLWYNRIGINYHVWLMKKIYQFFTGIDSGSKIFFNITISRMLQA